MLSADITALDITGAFTADDKVYDGTTDATVATRSLVGTITGDVVTLVGNATFDTKNVGTGKTVTMNGASLSGADAGNYNLTSVADTTADITVLTAIGHRQQRVEGRGRRRSSSHCDPESGARARRQLQRRD